MILNDIRTAIGIVENIKPEPHCNSRLTLLIPHNRKHEVACFIRSILAQASSSDFNPPLEGLILCGCPIHFYDGKNIIATWLPVQPSATE